MGVFEDVAGATVRIEAGPARGSGFLFHRPDVIVTAYHVVSDCLDAAEAVSEDGDRSELELLGESDAEHGYDFAIFRLQQSLPGLTPLQPSAAVPERGRELLFAGFPHGIPDLLVQRAAIAGPSNEHAFYLDAAVNGGNSGGPAVDAHDGRAIGVVTASRFLGAADLDAMADQAGQLEAYCRQIAGHGQVEIMGISFTDLTAALANAVRLLRKSFEDNANTGIAIAHKIEHVLDECRALGV